MVNGYFLFSERTPRACITERATLDMELIFKTESYKLQCVLLKMQFQEIFLQEHNIFLKFTFKIELKV